MSNKKKRVVDPKSLENLKNTKGRPKLQEPTLKVAVRISQTTKDKIEEVAVQYQCFHGSRPRIGKLLDKIAQGELIIVPAPPKEQA